MDSPLLPQFDKRSDLNDVSLLDDPSMLADLSMESDIHGTSPPSLSSSNPHLYTREAQRNSQIQSGRQPFGQSLFASTSSTNSSSNYNNQNDQVGGRKVHIDHTSDDDDDDDDDEEDYATPVKNKFNQQNINKAKPRFSLFAAPRPPSAELHEDDDEEERNYVEDEREGEDQTIHARSNSKSQSEEGVNDDQEIGKEIRQSILDNKEDKLRSSLYELRKMNEVFDSVIRALEGVRGHNQRLAERVQQTSALLDVYTAIMGQAEYTQQLLLNPKWTGSTDDAEAIQAIEQAKYEAIQRAEEEARRQAELSRIAEEERERKLAERQKAESASRGTRGRGGGGGGGGGSSAFMSGVRVPSSGRGIPTGISRGTGSTGVRGRGTGIPRPSVAPARPTSATSTKRGTGTTTTTSSSSTTRGGGGLGGQYNHVKSSGYGPR
ncbi:uncharacterized protein L201_002057 [Kwoniella dendrophila CBS 6074]|uniref:DASH complex subunit DUO1 n=1 Tax=Kwoniella dendrophila CBS 6074 TaxID=1295534 RepID=A0AAX4JQ48_9TREE